MTFKILFRFELKLCHSHGPQNDWAGKLNTLIKRTFDKTEKQKKKQRETKRERERERERD